VQKQVPLNVVSLLDGGDHRPRLRPEPLPVKAALDVPLALAIIGLGIWIILAPWPVPGLTPPL
jgi:hypothetical protein